MLKYDCLTVGTELHCLTAEIDKTSVGILGERDSGKELLIPATLGLIDGVSGSIYLDNIDLVKSRDLLDRIRWRRISAVFYDPFTMFNPLYDVASHFSEIVVSHNLGNEEFGIEVGLEYVKLLGLDGTIMSKLPHQLSPLHAKKVAIALATFLEPDYILIDDIEFGLSDIGRASLINSLIDLMGTVRSTFVFLDNNPAILSRLTDYVIVLFKGRTVEEGYRILENPLHPYLIDLIRGEIKDTNVLGEGCPYSSQCRFSTSKCKTEVPWVSLDGRKVRCLGV
ncbi:ABC transporter ATP-binding protein [Metallosphaera tengchongensis]|uniref:ABC transporter ATP-binding protein n=1 Tax=Metallosphaera tengchongensis TaxID=1532350 RepID=A0A6N0NVE3_9CREN|nr:ATP-binding cassette domain-containing protein [Metallosphaera tengchongensis]QKQ99129.1 ABC transporter ATP-binding protein [Metallosphaera tengchongensis]